MLLKMRDFNNALLNFNTTIQLEPNFAMGTPTGYLSRWRGPDPLCRTLTRQSSSPPKSILAYRARRKRAIPHRRLSESDCGLFRGAGVEPERGGTAYRQPSQRSGNWNIGPMRPLDFAAAKKASPNDIDPSCASQCSTAGSVSKPRAREDCRRLAAALRVP